MHNYNVDRKYQYNCRIGNWSEEWELDEYKMKEYLKNKEKQKLVSTDKEDRLKRSLGGVNLSYANEGLVKFGYTVMIESDFMNAVVASNIWDKITGTEEAYGVTVTSQKEPIVRTAFQLLRYEQDQYQDDVIHYGQNFKIAVISRLSEKPLYLTSSHITPQKCAKFSRKQEVSISTNEGINSAWCFEYMDPKLRYEMKGQPVRSGEPVLIKHIPTCQWLATDNVQYNNEFGQEFEVFCNSYQCHNKTQNLIAEKVGRKTIETPMRNQTNQNTFRIVTALYPSQETQQNFEASYSQTLPRRRVEINKADLLNKLRRALINKNGSNGLLFFKNELLKQDKDNSGYLPQQQFKQTVQCHGINFSDLDIKEVIQSFQELDNKINYSELLIQLKGTLSEKRRNLINLAYDVLAEKLGQNVTLSGIFSAFNKIRHPDVVKKYGTDKEIFNNFVLSWGNLNPHIAISREQFESYYHDFSACVDKEDYFEVVLKNSWDIPN
ncbi:EF hand protein, putative (macronuclear) [Tetrahymena thermophila SB210]|uniref:EF hand protein, putative n=1 Tax=Tetrahymena thermophila (strain SB210) TaxID=312017 RepID=Q22WJ6_TETTS|nr:EF hand protein, putative [Tetrahymena thermophila SB210]8G2Z_0N Chain 0N, CFAP161A [Tetrahymena thermophila CU428]8G2Z_1N Chain 1N, CFAP161A [Tetrahymena thermophila CU428]8G2Z_2N Chain 2N, CFAP161A [Tetrahymena thermophila CU428]8G3D_0N Chain 0N, CFAP161A [Tetrahymena thermophila]8G3D_1N Chain 1N, CFAP161A [Tetrahymena thermophila]8G3D_2N Chain 2N, CFAP161A [Tetrahymena thermophila]EAR89421.1 EF hand protein, putative [Tetrahymena thermophila SB210]|eukprot:XP_001009666.1 EF hand protein, putative [Tetrahymena thermophila SB210]